MAKAIGSVEILDVTGQVIRSGRLAAAGIFAFGVVEIPGTVPGGSGQITIRVWDNSTGATYDTAELKLSTVVSLFGLGGGVVPIRGLGQVSDFVGMVWVFPPVWETNAHIERITLSAIS